MLDFLLIYEVKVRELENICLVAAELRRRGYSVGIINTWDAEFSLIKKRPSAKVVIVSACYNSDTYRYLTSFAKSFEKVVNLQWEQVIISGYDIKTENNSFAIKGEAKKVIHLCWGKQTVKRLIENYDVDEKHLPVVGYLPLDFYDGKVSETLIEKEALYSKYNIADSRKTVLFISSFALVDLPKSLFAINVEEINKLALDTNIQSQKDTLEYFEKFIIENKGYQIIYRPHPTEANNEVLLKLAKEYDNFYCVSSEAIKHWINACDVAITLISSSVAELFVAKKKTIVLRPCDVHDKIDLPYYKNAKVVKTYDELNSAIKDEDCAFPIDEKNLLSYYDISEVKTYVRISDVLEDCYKSNDYKSPKLQLYNNYVFYKISKWFYRFTYYSYFNKLLIAISKKNDFGLGFLKRRSLQDFNEMRNELEYFKSRKKANAATKVEIQSLIAKLDEKLTK